MARNDPSALLNTWTLQRGFEMTVTEESTTGGRARTKRYGVVTEMRDTEKGKVGNKTGQVLMLITTNKQDAEAPPYALQAKLLDFKGLATDLLTSYRKELPAKPTLIQIARKHALCVSCPGHPLCVVVVGKLKSVHKAWMKDNTPKDDSPSTTQAEEAASAEEPEADASQEEEADEEDEADEQDEVVVSSAGVAAGDESTTDEDNDDALLLVKPVLNALTLKASPLSGARAAAAPAPPVRRKASKELAPGTPADSAKSEAPGTPASAGSGKKKKSRRISVKDGAAPKEAKKLKLSLAGIHEH